MNNNGTQEISLAPRATIETIALRLEKDDRLSWMMMPELFGRVRKFCAAYDPDMNSDLLCRTMAIDFMADKPNFCLIIMSQGGKTVGHAITLAYDLWGKKYADVFQTEIDKGVIIPRETLDGFGEIIEEWAQMKQCDVVQASVVPGAQQRRLSIFHDFGPYRTIMRRKL